MCASGAEKAAVLACDWETQSASALGPRSLLMGCNHLSMKCLMCSRGTLLYVNFQEGLMGMLLLSMLRESKQKLTVHLKKHLKLKFFYTKKRLVKDCINLQPL